MDLKITEKELYYKGFLGMLLSVGFIWAHSAYGKLIGGTFVANIDKTLYAFAGKNPHGWYKSYLENLVIPNSGLFGTMVLWGEVFTAVSVGVSCLYLLLKGNNRKVEAILLLGLVVGMIQNFNFYFASGWMSPSGSSINLLMFLIQLIGFIVVLLQIKKKNI